MKYIKTYESYKGSEMINEEFIGKLVKGSLSRLFQLFAAPFKDLVNDIKNSFKDDDPNSIKGVILTNLNQAIDSAQKSLRDKNLQEGDIVNVMSQFITNLTDLSNGIGKDFNDAIENKSKASGAYEVAKAILIGSKEANWKGIVGLLNDSNYKYSKPKYELALTNASAKKQGPLALKAKQDAAMVFFDNFQKDITTQINKELTEEELKKIYDDSVKKGGGQVSSLTYDKIKELYDQKKPVMYKRDGYDNNRKPEDQKDEVGTKIIDSLDDQGNVGFKSENGKEFKKKYEDILGPAVEGEKGEDTATNITNNLKEIKDDKEKLAVVKKFTDFVKSATVDQLARVDDIINPAGAKTEGQ